MILHRIAIRWRPKHVTTRYNGYPWVSQLTGMSEENAKDVAEPLLLFVAGACSMGFCPALGWYLWAAAGGMFSTNCFIKMRDEARLEAIRDAQIEQEVFVAQVGMRADADRGREGILAREVRRDHAPSGDAGGHRGRLLVRLVDRLGRRPISASPRREAVHSRAIHGTVGTPASEPIQRRAAADGGSLRAKRHPLTRVEVYPRRPSRASRLRAAGRRSAVFTHLKTISSRNQHRSHIMNMGKTHRPVRQAASGQVGRRRHRRRAAPRRGAQDHHRRHRAAPGPRRVQARPGGRADRPVAHAPGARKQLLDRRRPPQRAVGSTGRNIPPSNSVTPLLGDGMDRYVPKPPGFLKDEASGGKVLELVRKVSDHPGAEPLWAAWRLGLKDLQAFVLQPFPYSTAPREEPGSIGTPREFLDRAERGIDMDI